MTKAMRWLAVLAMTVGLCVGCGKAETPKPEKEKEGVEKAEDHKAEDGEDHTGHDHE